MLNPRDRIEQAARCADFESEASTVPEHLRSPPWVRDGEAATSIAISLKRIADALERSPNGMAAADLNGYLRVLRP